MPVISKSEFARAIGVGRAAVGNMIRRRQISGGALVERGGRILVDADVARSQLRDRLDVKQREINGRAQLDGDVTGEPDGPIRSSVRRSSLPGCERSNWRTRKLKRKPPSGRADSRSPRTCASKWGASPARWSRALKAVYRNSPTQSQPHQGLTQRDVLLILRTAWRAIRTRLAGVEAEAEAIHEPEFVEARL